MANANEIQRELTKLESDFLQCKESLPNREHRSFRLSMYLNPEEADVISPVRTHFCALFGGDTMAEVTGDWLVVGPPIKTLELSVVATRVSEDLVMKYAVSLKRIIESTSAWQEVMVVVTPIFLVGPGDGSTYEENWAEFYECLDLALGSLPAPPESKSGAHYSDEANLEEDRVKRVEKIVNHDKRRDERQ